VKEKSVLPSVIHVAYQEYRCYHGYTFLRLLIDVLSEQMRFRAAQ